MQEKVSSTVETFERKPSLSAAFPAALPLLCVLCALTGSFHRPASTADYDPLVNTASTTIQHLAFQFQRIDSPSRLLLKKHLGGDDGKTKDNLLR